MNIYHVINPYQAGEETEAQLVQQKTIQSLLKACEFSKYLLNVKLVFRVSNEDLAYFKKKYDSEFILFSTLVRFSSDIGKGFNVKRDLPLLNDLACSESLEEIGARDRDYVIITNMDICVQPFFYSELLQIITKGFDCFVINRRTVEKDLLGKDLELAYTADGEQHIGHDCFIVPFYQLQKFRLKDHILGIGFVFRPFLLNCILHSENFHEFDDVYLTFHYGDDMEWKDDKYSDYLEHNRQMLIDVHCDFIPAIRGINGRKKQWVEKFFKFDFLEKV